MTIQNARSFLNQVQKEAVLIERNKLPEWRFDAETVLSVRVQFGRKSGWIFSDEDYKSAIEQYVEEQLSNGRICRKGRFVVLFEEFPDGTKGFEVFAIGAKELNGCLVQGDSIANLCGGSMRN